VDPKGRGGLALDFRFGTRARATKDMDLAHINDPATATADLLMAGQHNLGDHFTFVITKTDDLDALQDGIAVRYRVLTELGGQTFEEMIVDIGFVEGEKWESDSLALPDYLSFAAIAPIIVPIIPLAKHVAEKLHAYARNYGVGTRPSSREKDLVDLVVIAMFCPFYASELHPALHAVFAVRAMHPLPPSVPHRQRVGASSTASWLVQWASIQMSMLAARP
jgi:hypothetical protein